MQTRARHHLLLPLAVVLPCASRSQCIARAIRFVAQIKCEFCGKRYEMSPETIRKDILEAKEEEVA